MSASPRCVPRALKPDLSNDGGRPTPSVVFACDSPFPHIWRDFSFNNSSSDFQTSIRGKGSRSGNCRFPLRLTGYLHREYTFAEVSASQSSLSQLRTDESFSAHRSVERPIFQDKDSKLQGVSHEKDKFLSYDRIGVAVSCREHIRRGSRFWHDGGFATAAWRILQEVEEGNMVSITGSTHPFARAEFDEGVVSDGMPMEHMLLQLQRGPAEELALQGFIEQVQDVHSPQYHNWLTAEEFGTRFGPAEQDIQAVTARLQSHGMRVNLVYPSGMVIDFSGNAGNVREAFRSEIHN
jgi:hypothetical protein